MVKVLEFTTQLVLSPGQGIFAPTYNDVNENQKNNKPYKNAVAD